MDPDTWFATHDPIEGSWWSDWSRWLADASNKMTNPPEMGAPAAGYPQIADAPGTYIYQS
ncbi:hypothetical protein [Phycobacter sp. K97]|uniref:hypothetical protein n=1 Tax=Phycobacter sedimenti TaxID=3133977 RepID=UPI00311DAE7D